MNETKIADYICSQAQGGARFLVGIAGPPGSGKSTLAKRLLKALNARLAEATASIVPMDGFHYDNAVLEPRGLLARKGAPETFDAAAFVDLVRQLRRADQPIAIPVFDNRLDLARAQGSIIETRHSIVLIEGNYLLLRQAPWNELLPLFDKTLFLAPPMEVLEQRLIQRWLDHGMDRQAATQRARGNDLVNARTVIEHSASADWLLDLSGDRQ